MRELSLFTGAGGGLLGTVHLGYPIGSTGLESLATDRIRYWLRQHGIFSQEAD